MKFPISAGQLFPLTIISTAVQGVFNGPLSYTSSDTSIITASASDDTLSVDLTSVGPAGSATITVTDGYVTQTFEVEAVSQEARDISFAVAPAPAVTESAAAALTTDQVAALTTAQTAALTTDQVAALTTGQAAALATDQVAALTTGQVAALNTSQVQALATGSAAS